MPDHSNAVEVLDPRPLPDLRSLADTINREVAEVERAGRAASESLSDGIRAAMRAGAALNQAAGLVPAGQWETWVSENVAALSVGTVRKYRQIARHRDLVEAKLAEGGRLKWGDVFSLVAFQDQPASRFALPDVTYAEIDRLYHEEGWSASAIAAEVGTSWTTVKSHVDPAYKKRRDRRKRAQQVERRRAAKALAQQEERASKDRLAKAVGGSLERIYNDNRRSSSALDALIASAPDAEARQALNEALAATYTAEDAIVRALRLSRRDEA